MGVETVIVCSPPDVTVFLDDKELAPTSYGRYVIPHLSRQPHLLRVQRAGFADTIERLDFPMTSLHEWVNIKLVPRRPDAAFFFALTIRRQKKSRRSAPAFLLQFMN